MEVDEDDEQNQREIDEVEEALPPLVVPKQAPRIQRLDQSVVNRIAAGEVIQRPISAIRDLVENSLDADSTSVNVVVKDGGLELIQVSDDGHGINYEDLRILCERHTTSKLSKFEDLHSIKSMGFRGDALASMTYVGHLSVTTIATGQLNGYRVSYKDGVMEHEPEACADVKGTQIMIKNLFYNMDARRKTLQNYADDYVKIVDMLSRFAIHHINVGFSCKKHGAASDDIHTDAVSSKLDAIRSVYGSSVACNLTKIDVSEKDPSKPVFEMNGYMSNSNYSAENITMVLFINDRLVECSALKRSIEKVYSAAFPKAYEPFVYMSIQSTSMLMYTQQRESLSNLEFQVKLSSFLLIIKVSLLNQEFIIAKIQSAVESKLLNSNDAKKFEEQISSEELLEGKIKGLEDNLAKKEDEFRIKEEFLEGKIQGLEYNLTNKENEFKKALLTQKEEFDKIEKQLQNSIVELASEHNQEIQGLSKKLKQCADNEKQMADQLLLQNNKIDELDSKIREMTTMNTEVKEKHRGDIVNFEKDNQTMKTELKKLKKEVKSLTVRVVPFGLLVCMVTLVLLYYGMMCFIVYFLATGTFGMMDAVYFMVVTGFTVGYGDLVPPNVRVWLISDFHASLGCLVSHIVGQSLKRLLCRIMPCLMVPARRVHLFLSLLCAIVGLVLLGFGGIYIWEIPGRPKNLQVRQELRDLSLFEAFQLSIMTMMTTVGYGNASFITPEGKLFAAIWIPICTCSFAVITSYLVDSLFDWIAERAWPSITRLWERHGQTDEADEERDELLSRES